MKKAAIAAVTAVIFCTAMGNVSNDIKRHMVRVAVLKDAETVTLAVRGRYVIKNAESLRELDQGRRLRKTVVTMTPNGFKFGELIHFGKSLRIESSKDVSIYTSKGEKRYRGEIDLVRDKNNKILVINRIDLEEYVRGVLYHEVPHYWPMNAIKAQAVATRSYALYRTIERKAEMFDVTSDIYSQVYGGKSSERYRSNVAAKRTRGEILTYNGQVLPAYFHSTCGGRTEHIQELWDQDLKPLYGVVCGFCNKSPHYLWKKNFRSKDVQDKLVQNGYKIGLIKELKVVERTDSGRVKKLKITDRDGGSITLSGTRFREIIGPNVLKSNLFEVEMQGYYFDLIGRGWGHGVGMCQWGAYQMAKEKYKYTSILKHYYPGAVITNYLEQ